MKYMWNHNRCIMHSADNGEYKENNWDGKRKI